MSTIEFFDDYPGFEISALSPLVTSLEDVFEAEKISLSDLSCIFVNDREILRINRTFLQHNYTTDIITFFYNNASMPISGELYISLDTVMANAMFYNVRFDQELLRVVVHGCLHLCGYDDKTEDEVRIMRSKEDYYLSLLPSVEVFFPSTGH